MDTVFEFGTDIKNTWKFTDGDLNLVSNDKNIEQAVTNRLNTVTDSLGDFYYEYGSRIRQFLGWRKNETTLRFMKIELESCLRQDPRFVDFDVELQYNSKKEVEIVLNTRYNDGTDLSQSFVLGEGGVVVEDAD